MGAPKLNQKAFSKSSNQDNSRNKQIIEVYKSKIAELLKDERVAKKAALLIQEMIKNAKK